MMDYGLTKEELEKNGRKRLDIIVNEAVKPVKLTEEEIKQLKKEGRI